MPSDTGVELVKSLLNEFRSFRDTEFREFREDQSEWRREFGERLLSMEREVKLGLVDNGRDSRMTKVEKKLDGLLRLRMKLAGAVAVISFVGGVIKLAHMFIK